MSSFLLKFDTDNAAFRDDTGALQTSEIQRILTEFANRIEGLYFWEGEETLAIHDLNGNRVGEAVIDEDEESG